MCQVNCEIIKFSRPRRWRLIWNKISRLSKRKTRFSEWHCVMFPSTIVRIYSIESFSVSNLFNILNIDSSTNLLLFAATTMIRFGLPLENVNKWLERHRWTQNSFWLSADPTRINAFIDYFRDQQNNIYDRKTILWMIKFR